MKTALIGYYGAGNFGDELLFSVIRKTLVNRGDSVLSLSFDPNYTEALHGVKAIDCSRRSVLIRPQFIANLRDVDLLLFGGGGLFHDYWPATLKWIAAWRRMCAFLRIPFSVYAAGVGPIKTDHGYHVIERFMRSAKRITVRDEYSQLLMNTCFGIYSPISFDGAFLASPLSYSESISCDFSRRVMLISLRKWRSISDPKRLVHTLSTFVRGSLDSFSCIEKIRFLACEKEDNEIIDMVRKSIDDVDAESVFFDIENPLKPYRDVVVTVGMRLHSLIASALSNVPFLGISYDPKVSGFVKAFESEQCFVDVSQVDSLELIRILKSILLDYSIIRDLLRSRVERACSTARSNLNYVLDV
ncbi:MAG TPA: polysaccharide pyruvyl transferase family protein [Mesotoga sp.]|nr:polysaccharide pyruvyl transferase family protein [Mesotoga sp.]